MTLRPFHLAFPVADLAATRYFYETILGCTLGRTSTTWIDFNFFGHQITAHLCQAPLNPVTTNTVDRRAVPVQHWGIILEMDQWQALAERLRQAQITFVIEPYLRFQGEAGEQATFFIKDPDGHALEFKAFAQDAAIFASASNPG